MALTLGVMYLVGIFNKKISLKTKKILKFLNNVEISWANVKIFSVKIYFLIGLLFKRRKRFFRILRRRKIIFRVLESKIFEN